MACHDQATPNNTDITNDSAGNNYSNQHQMLKAMKEWINSLGQMPSYFSVCKYIQLSSMGDKPPFTLTKSR